MTSKKRTHKMEKLARIYDAEVLPVWASRFGRMLLRDLEVPAGGQVLDVACGTGYPAVEILRRMPDDSRLIAIDGSSAMLDVARKKVAKLGGKRVFFRTESAEPRLSFTDDVYDVVVCNLGLSEMDDIGRAVADFARVTRPGGIVRCTLPLQGTFQEFYDLYREVLIKHDRHEALNRLNDHVDRTPTAADCQAWMENARLADATVDVESFTMLFKSSREFFFAPVIEYGPLAEWKAIAGQGQEMQDIFWYIKEAIDAYFGGRAFEITVMAGCLSGRKRETTDEDVTGRVDRVEEVRGAMAANADDAARAIADVEGTLDTDGTFDDDADTGVAEVSDGASPLGSDARARAEAPTRRLDSGKVSMPGMPATEGTAEIDLAELEEIREIEFDSQMAIHDDVELEAFMEGAQRPAHLAPSPDGNDR